jgi:nicotinamidase-related amidase
MSASETALLVCDLQNDFLHPEGAYGRAGIGSAEVAALPGRVLPLARAMRGRVIATQFTLVPDGGEVLISPHLKRLRPFLQAGDFAPGSWGQAVVEALGPADFLVEKIAYSAFYMSRLDWLLRRLGVTRLLVCGVVTNGGVTATVRDALVRDFEVTVLEDGCAAFEPASHERAIAALRGACEVGSVARALERVSDAG